MKNSEVLQSKFDTVVKTAEVPYQANRRALKAIDILNDSSSGLREIDITIRGIEMLIEDLNDLRVSAKSIQNSSLRQLRKASENIPTPGYGRMKTVLEFSDIAIPIAKIGKAITEMRKTENFLLRGRVTKVDLKKGIDDIAYFSGLVANEAMGVIKRLKVMKTKISAYKRELLNAVD